ncbi:MAG TPA: hypothetical protein VJX94_22735 [Stellaceae bacterium]|nr:hypothetical protein [Stellaceae bacterium]
MAFATDMSAAARRHLEAGDSLAKGRKRRDVAGYLYGIAAECAIKAMMLELGMRPVADRRTADDPFFAHFPELRSMLRDALSRRRGSTLVRLIQDDRFLNNWSTRMRYSHGRDIEGRWVKAWAEQARQAVGSIGT